MPNFGWSEGHGLRRREEIRNFRREEAGALANARMAELEREQTGQTRRTRMEQAGLMEREKMGQAGAMGQTKIGQGGMRDTFKDRSAALQSAYEQMDKLYPVDDMGVRINPVTGKPFTEEAWQTLTQRMSDAALKYSGAGGVSGEGVGQADVESQGSGFLTTAGGDRYDVDGSEITKSRMLPSTNDLGGMPGTAAPIEPTGIIGTNLSQEPSLFERQKAYVEATKKKPKRGSLLQRAVPEVSEEEKAKQQSKYGFYQKYLQGRGRVLGGY